jgi:hypothetical protein
MTGSRLGGNHSGAATTYADPTSTASGRLVQRDSIPSVRTTRAAAVRPAWSGYR